MLTKKSNIVLDFPTVRMLDFPTVLQGFCCSFATGISYAEYLPMIYAFGGCDRLPPPSRKGTAGQEEKPTHLRLNESPRRLLTALPPFHRGIITYGRRGGDGRPRGDGRTRGVTLGLALGVAVALVSLKGQVSALALHRVFGVAREG